MEVQEGIAELERFRAIVSPFGREAIDAVLGEVERLTKENERLQSEALSNPGSSGLRGNP